MKKALIFAASALMLTSCGKEIEQQSAPRVTTFNTTTADQDAVPAEMTPAETEEAPAVTTTATAKKEEPSKAETTAKAPKKAEPAPISAVCMDTVEVYHKVKLSEFVTESSAVLANGDDILDTETLGEHEVTLKFEQDGASVEKKVTYTVIDSTAPVILLGDTMSVSVGEWFDPADYISYADNFDRAPSFDWSGTVDTSAAGVYPITVYISDHNGNTLTQDIDVTVSDYVTDPYYDDSVIYFSDFRQQYAADGREFGIDVSRWQGSIDFDAVASEGCSFAIVRMGYGEFGGADLDAYYYDNIAGAKNAGLKVGVYFYSTDTTTEGARATARRMVEVLGGQPLDMPIAFDWEEFQHFQNYGISLHDLSEVFEAFADELRQNGYDTMLYSSKNFLERFWENKNDHPVWVAQYYDELTYSGDWYIWQRCGTGRISGIDGAVDLNVMQEVAR